MAQRKPPQQGTISVSGPASVEMGPRDIIALAYQCNKTGGKSYLTNFSVSELPSGVTASFSPSSGLPSFSTTLTLTAQDNYVRGNYTITVRAQNTQTAASTTTAIMPKAAQNIKRTVDCGSVMVGVQAMPSIKRNPAGGEVKVGLVK